MGFFDLARIPEPEVMDEAQEVQAYSSAASQRHLDQLDNSFVDHAIALLNGREEGCALDIGTGPGQIVLKLARKLKSWRFVGVDRSPSMIAQAREKLRLETDLSDRIQFQLADGNQLVFRDASFDLVICNSVLHHLAEPGNLLSEMARLAKPDGAVLLRDLRRPSSIAYPVHVRVHGRHYSGTMYKLFCDSVRAAYTPAELKILLSASPLRGAGVFVSGRTHLGFARPAATK